MDIWNNLILFADGNLEMSPIGYLIFTLTCAFFGLLIFLLDWCYCILKKKSHLNLTYNDYNKIPFLLIAYIFGAGGVGFIGVITNILNFNINSAIGVGIGWLFILPRIFASYEIGIDRRIKNKSD